MDCRARHVEKRLLRAGAEEEDGGERGGEAKREDWRRVLWFELNEESQPRAEGRSMFAIEV